MKKRILIIDDSKDIHMFLKIIFERKLSENFIIDSTDIVDNLNYHNHYELIIIDYDLNNVNENGLSIMDKFLEINPNQKIVLISANDLSIFKDYKESDHDHNLYFIKKPFQMNEMVDKLKSIIDN